MRCCVEKPGDQMKSRVVHANIIIISCEPQPSHRSPVAGGVESQAVVEAHGSGVIFMLVACGPCEQKSSRQDFSITCLGGLNRRHCVECAPCGTPRYFSSSWPLVWCICCSSRGQPQRQAAHAFLSFYHTSFVHCWSSNPHTRTHTHAHRRSRVEPEHVAMHVSRNLRSPSRLSPSFSLSFSLSLHAHCWTVWTSARSSSCHRTGRPSQGAEQVPSATRQGGSGQRCELSASSAPSSLDSPNLPAGPNAEPCPAHHHSEAAGRLQARHWSLHSGIGVL